MMASTSSVALPLPLPVVRGAMKRKMPPAYKQQRSMANIVLPISQEDDHPIDFSLPTRSRARLGSVGTSTGRSIVGSASVCGSDTDSDASKISPNIVSNEHACDLTKKLSAFSAFQSKSTPTTTQPLNLMTPHTPSSSLAQVHGLLMNGHLLTPQMLQQTLLMAKLLATQHQQPLLTPIQLPLVNTNNHNIAPTPLPQLQTTKKVNNRKRKGAALPLAKKIAKHAAQASPTDSSTTELGDEYIINPATGNRVRRNYKNMTSERRKEANARERSRVHIIGSAFDKVRAILPAVQDDNKLSKLSILRIACKYIQLLGAMQGKDYTTPASKNGSRVASVEECLEQLNDTITNETKVPLVGEKTERSNTKSSTLRDEEEEEGDGEAIDVST